MRENKVHYPHDWRKNKTRCGRDENKVWVADECEIEQVTCKECLSGIEESKANLVGKKIGNWTVLENKLPLYLCRCVCGVEKTVRKSTLISGESISCGCVKNGKGVIKTGLSGTKLYKVWQEMLRRCNSEKDGNYIRYGARGIKVCEEWTDPIMFIEWANKNGHKKGLSLDRIDNNGNYEPKNCRFATPTEQARNTRRNVRITINGVAKILQEWSEETGIKHRTLKYRYNKGDRGERLIRNVGA